MTQELSLQKSPQYGEALYFTRAVVRRKFSFSRSMKHVLFGILFTASFFFATLFASQEFIPGSKPAPPPSLHAWKTSGVSPAGPTTGPQVTIIIDDTGENFELLQELRSVTFPVTVSVLPGSPYCRESAEWAFEHGIEVMVHLPMEPISYPQENPGTEALFASMNRVQITDRTGRLLDAVPHAVGTNNHMGSRLTEMRGKMTAVMDSVASRNFYFIDSRTIADSVAYDMAVLKGIRTARRTSFLDNVVDSQTIASQIEELIDTARAEGNAVGICHLKGETVRALIAFQASDYPDVRFTFASEAVRPKP